MPSNYEETSRYNEEQLGRDRKSRMSQVAMYADSAHFIYELLQNADDADATEICFTVKNDCLQIEHDGKPFTEQNVKAISYFGMGNTDITKIGHFGLGFKSVFAYTASPMVHSGEESFLITDLYTVIKAPYPQDLTLGRTRFVLPFDQTIKKPAYIEHGRLKSADSAYREITIKLTTLGAETLLFTKSLAQIHWKSEEDEGHYLRNDIKFADISREIYIDTGADGGHSYLVFERRVVWQDDSGIEKEHRPIQIAFQLNKKLKDAGYIEKIEGCRLSVFFKTDKETHVGFIIQGPYRTTPARDNVPQDDDFNLHLIGQTAELVVMSLLEIKKINRLDLNALKTLPINPEKFKDGTFFHPLYVAVRDAFINLELLPSGESEFVSAKNGKLASSADLRGLLKNDQLRSLFQTTDNLKWLVEEITQDRTPELRSYLMKELSVEEVRPDSFVSKITENFLMGQTDEWFVEFYEFFSGLKALWRPPRWDGDKEEGLLRSKPIIRLQDNSLNAPFTNGKPAVFLPPPDETDFPIVKRQIADNEQAKNFLKLLGLSEPDAYDEIIEFVLPKYTKQDGPSISEHEHQVDIQKILRAIRSDLKPGKERVIDAAKQVPFLKATDLLGKTTYRKPGEIYSPRQELKIYFDGCKDIWFLDEPEGEEEWKSFGVATKPRFRKVHRELESHTKMRLRGHQGHTKDIETTDYVLEGLKNFLGVAATENELRAENTMILWNFLSEYLAENQYFRFNSGSYRWFWFKELSASFEASWIKLLRNTEWLPKRGGNFIKPSDLSLDDLPEIFVCDERLSDLLKMKKNAVAKLALEAGISPDLLQFCINNPSQVLELIEKNSRVIKIPPQLENPVGDPTRRRKGVLEARDNAPDVESVKRERSIQLGLAPVTAQAKAYLRPFYTHGDKMMYCQCCRNGMPFLLDRSEDLHYFEAVQCVKGIKKHYYENRLALCPTCAAKYKFSRQTDDATILSLLVNHSAADTVPSIEIPITLANQQYQIFFVGKHWFDLKTVLGT